MHACVHDGWPSTWQWLQVMGQISQDLTEPHPSNDHGISQARVPSPAGQLQQVLMIT